MSDDLYSWPYDKQREFFLEGFAYGCLCELNYYVKKGTPVKIESLANNPRVINCLEAHTIDESAKIVAYFPDPKSDNKFEINLPVDRQNFVNDAIRAAVQASEYFNAQCMDIDLKCVTATYRLVSATEADHVIARETAPIPPQ